MFIGSSFLGFNFLYFFFCILFYFLSNFYIFYPYTNFHPYRYLFFLYSFGLKKSPKKIGGLVRGSENGSQVSQETWSTWNPPQLLLLSCGVHWIACIVSSCLILKQSYFLTLLFDLKHFWCQCGGLQMQAFIGENQENAWVGLGTEDYAQFQRSVIAHV